MGSSGRMPGRSQWNKAGGRQRRTVEGRHWKAAGADRRGRHRRKVEGRQWRAAGADRRVSVRGKAGGTVHDREHTVC